MGITEARRVEPRASSATRWHGQALGLTLECDAPFPGLPEVDDAGTGRLVTWREEFPQTIEQAWLVEEGTVLVDLRHTDGRLFMRIDQHDSGYRIWAPYYGRHLVTSDGAAIRSALPRVTPWRWQRLFFAQTLPLAAALQGLAVFHASAVALHGRVLAFVGASGTGKTSVAAHLVSLGAEFVTDDVLALEPDGTTVHTHPGPARLSIESAELNRVPSIQLERLGEPIGRSDKLMLEPKPIRQPLPLLHLYFLQHDKEISRVRIVEQETSAARPLLASGFINYLRSPDHLQRHLDACAATARSVPLFEVRVPQRCRAREVAAMVMAHTEKVLLGAAG